MLQEQVGYVPIVATLSVASLWKAKMTKTKMLSSRNAQWLQSLEWSHLLCMWAVGPSPDQCEAAGNLQARPIWHIQLLLVLYTMVLKFLETRILKMKRRVVSFNVRTHLAVPASTLAVFYSCRFVYTHSNAALSCRPNIYQPKLNTELLHPFNTAFLCGPPIFRSRQENWK